MDPVRNVKPRRPHPRPYFVTIRERRVRFATESEGRRYCEMYWSRYGIMLGLERDAA